MKSLRAVLLKDLKFSSTYYNCTITGAYTQESDQFHPRDGSPVKNGLLPVMPQYVSMIRNEGLLRNPSVEVF